ncbi:hypothetical protein ACH5RR_012487 [Cinchona calisaya]|uniref:Uncharacterized protein n=1 Tax=Cinchona calisaya TaxID=153742 RepID=A0ABD3AAA4_9GENT
MNEPLFYGAGIALSPLIGLKPPDRLQVKSIDYVKQQLGVVPISLASKETGRGKIIAWKKAEFTKRKNFEVDNVYGEGESCLNYQGRERRQPLEQANDLEAKHPKGNFAELPIKRWKSERRWGKKGNLSLEGAGRGDNGDGGHLSRRHLGLGRERERRGHSSGQ